MPSPLPLAPKSNPGVGPPAFVPSRSAFNVDPPEVPVTLRLLVTFALPSSQMVLVPVKSVIPKLPAPSALPLPAERIFQVWPPVLVFASDSHVPKLVAPPKASGV